MPEPTVFHGPSLDREWDSLDPIDGYNIVRVTPENAATLGYPTDDPGLKVRYFRRHLSDAADLADAAGIIADSMRRQLVLVADPQHDTDFWEPALTAPV
ncbi:MAG TPA: hypothetical protein VGN37_15585 [Actinocatenispora sp.]